MDKASVYESGDFGLKSWRGCFLFLLNDIIIEFSFELWNVHSKIISLVVGPVDNWIKYLTTKLAIHDSNAHVIFLSLIYFKIENH